MCSTVTGRPDGGHAAATYARKQLISSQRVSFSNAIPHHHVVLSVQRWHQFSRHRGQGTIPYENQAEFIRLRYDKRSSASAAIFRRTGAIVRIDAWVALANGRGLSKLGGKARSRGAGARVRPRGSVSRL